MGLSKKFLEELEKSEKLIDNVAVISPYSNETSKETKKKRQNSVSTRSSESSVDFFEELDRLIAEKEEEDIAPLPFTDRDLLDETSKGLREAWKAKAEEEEKKEKESKGLDFFDSGAFRNGYNAGDVTKTILGTVGDVGLNLVEGVVGTVEGIVDLGAYGVAGVADVFGADKWADNLKKTTSKSQTDFLFGGASDYLDKYSVLGRTSESIVQGIGQVGGLIATGGLGKTAKAATAITTGVMGASGMGSGMSEAYQGGATDGEAVAYGAISGTADALTEMIFGGLGKSINAVGFSKGLSSADDMLAKTLSNKISNKIAKNVVQFGVKASGEGLEEFLAGVAQAAGKKATYMSEEDFWGILQDENLLEQFIVGAMASGVTQSGGLVKANKTGTDFITGYTDNEQAVIDKEVEKRIADQEKDGKKLTNNEKNKITEAVKEDLDKGYISIDTIEEVLGGDSYKSYQDTVKNEDALLAQAKSVSDELQSLNSMRIYEMTGEQYDRREELRVKKSEFQERIKNMKKTSERDILQRKYQNEVEKVARGSRLESSYFERARGGEAFTADLSKYDEKQRATIQSAIDAGFLNNRGRTHDFVNLIAKISADKGVTFDFLNNEKLKTSGFAVGGATVNGYYDKKSHTIGINFNSKKALNTTVGHEITHVLEGTEIYGELQTALIKYAKAKGEYKDRVKDLRKIYGVKNIDTELVADLVGDYLFTDADFVNRLSTEHRNVFQKVFDEIKYLYKTATAGSKEARELERVKRIFEEAYRTNVKGQNKSGVQHSLSIKHTDGTIEEIADARDLTSVQAVNYLEQAQKGQIQGHSYVPVRKDTPQVIIDSLSQVGEEIQNRSLVMQVRKAQQAMRPNNNGNRSGKVGDNVRGHALTAEQIVEIVDKLDDPSAIVYQTNRQDKNGNALPNNVAVFVEYDNNGTESVAVIEFDSTIDPESIGTESGDTEYHTVVTVFEPDVERNGVPFDYAEELLSNPNNILLEIERRQPTGSATQEKHPNTSSKLPSTESIVSQKGKNVNTQFSLSTDSDGNTLSDGQKEFFKDSKVVDRDGNLLKVYHTTNSDFTVFDDSKKGSTTEAYNSYLGHFFTNDPEYMSEFPEFEGGKTEAYYLNMKNPIDMNSISKEAFLDIVEVTGGDVNEAAEIYDSEYEAEVERAKLRGGTPGLELSRLLEELTGEFYDDAEFHNALRPNYDKLIAKGYDGVINNMDGAGWANEYVVLNSNQAKLTTNTNPTSDPDVRYSLSDSDDDYSRIYDMQVEVNRLTESIREFEKTDDFKVAMDNLGKAINDGDVDSGVKAYQKWRVDSGYDELVNKRDALRVELEGLRKNFNDSIANKAIAEEKAAIEKSGLSEADYFRKQAVKEFGYTPYFYDAGYITPNGKMLNFSGEKGKHYGVRGQDHRAIGTIYAESSGTDALNRFVRDGNIRIMAESPGLDMSTLTEPTKEQYATIRKFASEYAGKEFFNVDFTDESGKVIGSLTYENRINPTRIINDIKHYYETGEIRQQSNLDRFRYSLSEDSKGRELSEAVKSRFGKSKVVDENGYLKVVYHGTASGEFTIFDKSKGSVEGDFGSGFYFTDNEADVSEHYEGGGPDFDNKVARRAEQIEAEEEIDYDEAKEKARAELFKGGHKFEVYLDIENPAIVGETMLFESDSYLEEYNEEDFDDYEEYIAEVEQLFADDVEKIIWEVERNTGAYSTEGLADIFYNAYYEGGIGIEELKSQINDLYLEDDNGNLIGNEVTRQVIESLGYDGIIDPIVSGKWNMEIEEGTTHYIVFKPNQIKAVTNQNPTDNPDINRSLSAEGEARREYGSYNVYGRDMTLGEDIAPVQDDVAPVASAQAAPEAMTDRAEVLSDDYAPITEDEAAMIENEALSSLTDEDAPPVVDMPYDEQRDTATIDDKSLRGISERVSDYLGLGRAERAVLEGIVQNYSQNENVTRDQLYSEIKDKFSVVEDSTPNEDVIQIKKDLRNMRIYVSDEVKADFGNGAEDGYSKFLRSNFGKLRLVKDIESGVPVDSAYEELSDLYPSYFPEDIINPADQLRKISEMASAESNDVVSMELSDEEMQTVADMVYSDIRSYMNDSRLEAAMEASQAPLDDDLAPLPEEDIVLEQEKRMLSEDYQSRKAEIQKLIDDKNGFISKRADELYWELSGLKKGVRASKELGYLLDHGYPWGQLKTALVNTKLHPDSRVLQDSAIESVVREALNKEYESLAYEINEIDSEYNEKVKRLEANAKADNKGLSVREVYEQKLANHRNTLAALEAGKERSLANFNEAIGKKLNEYNSLKNKNTKRANTLLQQMENLRLRRDNVQADYAKRIAKQQARLEAFESKSFEEFEQKELAIRRKDNHKRIVDGIKAKFAEQGYDLDEVFDNAKNLSTFATVDNTPQRVIEKSLGYKQGQILNDLTIDQVARNETEAIKWLNSVTDRKNGLLAQLVKKYGIKPGSKASAAAQMYAEGFFVDTNGDIIKYGDAELARDFPNEQVRQNIVGLAKDQRIRQFYDETLDRINDSRTRNAYPEIQKLDNYFLHFRAMEDTFSRLGLPFNPNDIKAKDLPTDLNGVTADLKPGQPYFASAKHREGIRTSYDLLGGLERYASSAKNQIYHIDDIQTLRAIRNYIADGYGQAKGLESLDSLSEEEAQEKIKQVYGSHLSTFAKFLNEEANVIAGKTALIDRGLEGIIGRRGITLLDTINKQVGANMVGFNVSSSLTNFIPVAQTFAKTNKFDFTKAFAQTVSHKVNSLFGRTDEFIENNPTVIRRRGADRFYSTPYQKVGDIGYTLMGVVDDISTEIIVRSKYNEYIRKGMSEQDATIAADKWTSRLMADRSLGQMPQIYNSRMLGLFTKFQLEVRNQLDAQFYDTIQEAKVSNEDIENGLLRNAKTAAKVTSTFAQLAIAQHLYGMVFEAVAGYNPAFDIVSVIATALGFDDDEDDEDTVLDNLGQGFLELLEDLPYTSAITGGGRIPISSALPIEDVLTAIKGEDANGNEISRKDAWKTVAEAAPYYFMPGGYGQLKKTLKGMDMFDEDLPIAGSYTDSGKLRYPVEDTVKNRLQAAIFGQYANENAREYFDGGHKALAEEQIQEFIDVDIPIQAYWDYREGLAALNKESETGTATLAQKIDYIMGLDLPIEKKNLLANNLTDRKEPIDLTGYEEYGNYEEFDFATKYPEKYAFLQDHNISVSEYEKFDEDTKSAYTWASKNPAKYTVSKAISDDLMTYRSYADALYDIKADKDEDGKSISGSRKEKVIEYINNLDADYGQKIILFKSEYPSDDTYNYEIIDYLNGRDDISYSDMVTILTELGFKVEGDNVYWD